MAKSRHILIAMDAFGTLFSPKPPVAHQYITVATQFGLRDLDESAISRSFYAAYKNTSKQYPNYGKSAGLQLEKWWSDVISGTFKPHIPKDQVTVLDDMVPALINRFWCSDGYGLHADARDFVQQVKQRQSENRLGESIVLGVASNSDTRVSAVLTSLGYRVANLRTSTEYQSTPQSTGDVDFQFVVHSYDVGHEKPAKEIFDATEALVRKCFWPNVHDDTQILKLYIGDEYVKDGQASQRAGWNAVVVDRNDKSAPGLDDLNNLLDHLSASERKVMPELRSVSSLSTDET